MELILQSLSLAFTHLIVIKMNNAIFSASISSYQIQGDQHPPRSSWVSDKEGHIWMQIWGPEQPWVAWGSFSWMIPLCQGSAKCGIRTPAAVPTWQGETRQACKGPSPAPLWGSLPRVEIFNGAPQAWFARRPWHLLEVTLFHESAPEPTKAAL